MKSLFLATAAITALSAAPALAQEPVGYVGVSYSNSEAELGGFEAEAEGYALDGAVAIPAFGAWTVTLAGVAYGQTVLARAERRETDDRLPAIVAAIKGADPDITLQAICNRLEAMRERTPRGRTSWQPSSVKMLLERAERLGLLE